MDFGELRRAIFNLYFEGSYGEGLDAIENGRSHFPEEDSTLTFYEACFTSLSGNPDRALEVLEAGLVRGLGWHPKMLLDSDLDATRSLDGWEEFVARSEGRVAEWGLDPPGPLVHIAENPTGTVVALPGVGDPNRFFDVWQPAVPHQWTLIGLAGDVPIARGEWAWPFDLSTDSLTATMRRLSLTPPVVLSGFSQGSNLAAKVAWDGDVEAVGLILFAGPAPDPWPTSRQRPVPTYIFVGDEDGARENCAALSKALSQAGVPNVLNVREGLGHELPEDLDQVFATGLEWILWQF